MTFHRGDRVQIHRKSSDEAWEDYMDDFIGRQGIVTDPDSSINDPDALVEVSIVDKGTHRLPQDCLKRVQES